MQYFMTYCVLMCEYVRVKGLTRKLGVDMNVKTYILVYA